MEQQTPKPSFDQWCVVELMGHQRIAGRVTEETLFGTALMRVDVPETSKGAGFTKYYGSTAIYCVTPVDEAIARGVAERLDPRPVQRYELPHLMPPAQVEDSADSAGDPDDESGF